MAGQLVAIKWPGGDPAKRLYSIASTPYESRRDSFYIDASLIEVGCE
jgi:ferredoxin-NADP reductase